MVRSVMLRQAADYLVWRWQQAGVSRYAVMLVCALACALTASRWWQAQDHLAQTRSLLRYQQASVVAANPATAADANAQFTRFFPAQAHPDAYIKALYETAAAHGVSIDHIATDGHTRQLGTLHLQQIQIALSATDEALRDFIYTLLKEHPAVSLDTLQLSRLDDGRLQVELSWGYISR